MPEPKNIAIVANVPVGKLLAFVRRGDLLKKMPARAACIDRELQRLARLEKAA